MTQTCLKPVGAILPVAVSFWHKYRSHNMVAAR